MRRRAAVEPVIAHVKDDHRLGRNHLKGRAGDRINAVLAAAGYNFSLLLRWFEEFLRALLLMLRCTRIDATLRLIQIARNALHGRLGATAKCMFENGDARSFDHGSLSLKYQQARVGAPIHHR